MLKRYKVVIFDSGKRFITRTDSLNVVTDKARWANAYADGNTKVFIYDFTEREKYKYYRSMWYEAPLGKKVWDKYPEMLSI